MLTHGSIYDDQDKFISSDAKAHVHEVVANVA